MRDIVNVMKNFKKFSNRNKKPYHLELFRNEVRKKVLVRFKIKY